ncbi:hypothetical protein LX32DRAFT_110830 [Colletotrichum zoysiae]|uniref:Uncharacterized protein n=1 Tax=Colletotrichum zoysiae TaxID=1216348 RepID=A0AAD9H873_9PEZI|nr:hypothetical protein LX32DRAFT_110830 [Colletotrichum zoysiae]
MYSIPILSAHAHYHLIARSACFDVQDLCCTPERVLRLPTSSQVSGGRESIAVLPTRPPNNAGQKVLVLIHLQAGFPSVRDQGSIRTRRRAQCNATNSLSHMTTRQHKAIKTKRGIASVTLPVDAKSSGCAKRQETERDPPAPSPPSSLPLSLRPQPKRKRTSSTHAFFAYVCQCSSMLDDNGLALFNERGRNRTRPCLVRTKPPPPPVPTSGRGEASDGM